MKNLFRPSPTGGKKLHAGQIQARFKTDRYNPVPSKSFQEYMQKVLVKLAFIGLIAHRQIKPYLFVKSFHCILDIIKT